MKALASPELLAVWEWGEDRHTIDRSLALLAAALPEKSWDELAALPVGRRDGLILELRWRIFGPFLEAHVPCSACGETMELELEIRELLARAEAFEGTEVELAVDGWEIRCRLPDSRDLAAIVGCGDEEAGRALLLERCVETARRIGRDCTADQLPGPVIDALSKSLEEADPLAVIELQSTCRECGHVGAEFLDSGSLVWSEVRGEVERLLREVDVLARRYGWTEDEVLALGPRRRRAYLELET